MYSSGQRRQDRIRTARKTGEPSRSDHHPPVSFGFDQTTLHTAQAEPIPYIRSGPRQEVSGVFYWEKKVSDAELKRTHPNERVRYKNSSFTACGFAPLIARNPLKT